jgi:serine/threonine-protein kinase
MIEQRRGETDFVKVLDFGIAKITDAKTKLTAAGLVCGTPEYMSPEQAKGADLDPRSDLYSVGVILYQMVTGLLPFESDTPVGFLMKHLTDTPMAPSLKQPEVEVPPALEALIMKALSKSPADRFANAEEMRDALLACAPDAMSPMRTASAPSIPVPATPAKPTAKAAPTSARPGAPRAEEAEGAAPPGKSGGKTGIIAAAAAVLVIAGGAGAYFATRGGEAPPPPTVAQNPAPPPVQPPQPPPVAPPVQPEPTVQQPEPVTPTTAEPSPPPTVDPAPPPGRGGKGGKGRDRRVAQLDPAEARSLMKQGDGLRAQLDCAGAIPLYKQAEAADPGLSEVLKKLAICYQSIGETKKAVRHYERYLATDPADAEKVKLILSTLR